MKTKQFIQKMQDEGYRVSKSKITSEFKVFINEELVAYVSSDERFSMYIIVAEMLSEKAFAFIVAYASTPVEKRKEPKRWYLQLNLSAVKKAITGDNLYLNQNKENKDITVLSSMHENSAWKTIFTEEDLKNIDETGFERIPVEEGE